MYPSHHAVQIFRCPLAALQGIQVSRADRPLQQLHRRCLSLYTSPDAVATLTSLAVLNLEKNNVKDFKAFAVEEGWRALRVLNLNFNKVSELLPLNAPNLAELSLIENKIEKL